MRIQLISTIAISLAVVVFATALSAEAVGSPVTYIHTSKRPGDAKQLLTASGLVTGYRVGSGRDVGEILTILDDATGKPMDLYVDPGAVISSHAFFCSGADLVIPNYETKEQAEKLGLCRRLPLAIVIGKTHVTVVYWVDSYGNSLVMRGGNFTDEIRVAAATPSPASTFPPHYWTGEMYDRITRTPVKPDGAVESRMTVTLEDYRLLAGEVRPIAVVRLAASDGTSVMAVVQSPMLVDGKFYRCPSLGANGLASPCPQLPVSAVGRSVEIEAWRQNGPAGSTFVVDKMWTKGAPPQ